MSIDLKFWNEEDRKSALIGWQPIAEAPLTCRLVLLWNDDIYMLGYYSEGAWREWGCNGKEIDQYRPLTHWMNLPEAPESD